MFNIKKRFFKRELSRTQANIWAQEFARFGTLIKRENMRQQYDIAQDAYQRLSAIKEPNEDQKKQIELAGKKRDAIKQSIQELDLMLNGCEPGENNNYPEGMAGIQQLLEEQIQKRENLKHFIKNYC